MLFDALNNRYLFYVIEFSCYIYSKQSNLNLYVESKSNLFYNKRFIAMFIDTVCVLFLIKLRWPKKYILFASLVESFKFETWCLFSCPRQLNSETEKYLSYYYRAFWHLVYLVLLLIQYEFYLTDRSVTVLY